MNACNEPCGDQQRRRRHVVITGTGRAGTTFLVALLTRCGLDTGFGESDLEHCASRVGHAGLEWDVRRPDAPYVVKNPKFARHAAPLLRAGAIRLDHVLIPVRDLYSASESRRDVVRRHQTDWPLWRRLHRRWFGHGFAGGLVGTRSLATGAQEAVLGDELVFLLHTLATQVVPVTLLQFPLLVQDEEYLYQKLHPLLKAVDKQRFVAAFRRTARPQLVHDFRRETNARQGVLQAPL